MRETAYAHRGPSVTHPSFPDDFLDAIDQAVMDRGGKAQGGNVIFRCPIPGHDDRSPSASWNRAKGVWRCFTCHDEGKGGGAINLADLLDIPRPERRRQAENATPRRIVATYDYTRDGELLFQAVRYEPKRFSQRRPDGAGSWIWNLKGVEPVLYRLEALEAADPSAWVYLCSGEKDVDRLRSLGLVATTNPMGEGKWRDAYTESLRGRRVAVLIDNDEKGRRHGEIVAPVLATACVELKVLELPDLPPKGDVSDWLDAGHSVEDLEAFRDRVAGWTPESAAPAGPPYSDDQYVVRDNAHHRFVPGNDSSLGYWQQMTNFAAWVTGDFIYPENDELNYSEVVIRDRSGRLHGPKRISASQFRRPDEWVGLFGSWPRVHDKVTRSQLLNAIQAASGTAPSTLVYDRTGWETSEGWRYLTSSGAMGDTGLDTAVRVEPGGHLNAITLQAPGDLEAIREAVRSVLEMRRIAVSIAGRSAITALCGAAFRAPLIPGRRANFTLNLVGETGSMKSGLAGLVLNLYGSEFNFDYLTGNWGSTAKANLDLLTRPRHTMLVIDDYLEGMTGGAQASRRAAERDALIRAQGNAAPVDRLKADATRNVGADPGVVLVTTQETLGSFLNESEIGRQLVIPLKKRSAGQRGDLDATRLIDASQTYGRSGVYNLAFSAYIQYLAGRMDRITKEADQIHTAICRNDLSGLRTISGRPLHERTRPAAGDLILGWRYFLDFAQELGVIDEDERESIILQVTGEIAEIMLAQDQFQANEAPERIFLELLQEAILSRHACLADRFNNDAPGQAEMMGWTPVERSSQDARWTEFRAAPHRIGWIDDEYVYLSIAATSKALQGTAASARKNMPFGERSIGQALSRQGLSLPGHGGRPTQNIRIGEHTEGGATMTRALVLPRALVFPDQPTEGVGTMPMPLNDSEAA